MTSGTFLRARSAAISGGGAALLAGLLAAAVYGIGLGLETGWRFGPRGGDMDFTGWPSAMAGLLCGGLGFLAFGWGFLKWTRVPRPGEILLPGIVFTFIGLSGLIELMEGPWTLAVAGPVVAAFSFGTVTVGLDDHAPGRWRVAAAVLLAGVMAPVPLVGL
ncbi:hypothetical protein GCM10027589_46640 [Actinocorallia lasiicapitis]